MESSFNDSTTEPILLRLQDVNIPMSVLQEKNPDTNRFTASVIAFRQNSETPSQPEVLLIQRGYEGSWGGSWEVPGGGYETGKDVSILQTALRETKEEASLEISSNFIFPLVYRTTFWHKESRMASYTFIVELSKEVPIVLSDEHLDWGFFNEKEICLFSPYEKGKAQDGHVMLKRKKETLRLFFFNKESLRNGDVNTQNPKERTD
ncbi:hypothetical protein N7517_002631 [Penicillium concentricum]|uniref:Nudix hydrolase domain-containing protein n=1 Tax=Penicillium concentricum TaxID=293559 RepID=A0A9W9SV26_9EURO|nr:uncharacterized protein N7517_002631 [Penicillium concentricum]KAJ5384720.1 hypothetical protein N7517_002631 [Penicillium concentricum]